MSNGRRATQLLLPHALERVNGLEGCRARQTYLQIKKEKELARFTSATGLRQKE